MAIQKTLIKNDRMKAVLHLIGTQSGDTTSIALTEFLAADETSSGTLRVNISGAYANSEGDAGITISRGSTSTPIVLKMFTFSEYPATIQLPSIAIANNSSIVVTFGDPGTVILDLRKVEGYVSPNTNVGV